MSKEDYKVYTVDQLADILQLSKITIRRYIAQGLINTINIKVGGRSVIRFSEAEVKRLTGNE